jgi:lysozyme family protein
LRGAVKHAQNAKTRPAWVTAGESREHEVADFEPCVEWTEAAENGYQANPADPGNWLGTLLVGTNRGISAPALRAWRGHSISSDDMRALSAEEARAILAANYWNPIRGHDLPAGLDLVVFDFAVTSGPRIAAMTLQSVVKADPDGFIGPDTLRKIDQAIEWNGVRAATQALSRDRRRYYMTLPGAATFGAGWIARAVRCEGRALELAGVPPAAHAEA